MSYNSFNKKQNTTAQASSEDKSKNTPEDNKPAAPEVKEPTSPENKPAVKS